MLFYVFVTCLYGLIKLGIKFLCFNVTKYQVLNLSFELALLHQKEGDITLGPEFGSPLNNRNDVLFFNAIPLDCSIVHHFWVSKIS
jgi:hypothetical protein